MRFFSLRAGLAGLAISLFTGLPIGAWAYRVQPLVVQISPSGAGSTTKLSLSNTEAVPITLELTPLRITVGEDGNAVRVTEEENLLVFPPQTIIPPGREQVVQVRYVGPPAIDSVEVYGVRISQLPVTVPGMQTGDTGTDLKVGVDFIAHIILQDDDMTPNVAVDQVERNADGSLTAVVSNDGDGIALASNLVWTLVGTDGETVEVAAENVDVEGFGAFLNDGVERRVVFKAEALAAVSGDVRVDVRHP